MASKKSKKSKLTEIAQAELVEAKVLTLDEIERKMVELACDDSNDLVVSMINEKKISMLEKIANLKIKRLQLKQVLTENVVSEVQPITVKFISSNTDEQKARLERIDKEILDQTTVKQNA